MKHWSIYEKNTIIYKHAMQNKYSIMTKILFVVKLRGFSYKKNLKNNKKNNKK